ncbi:MULTISPECIES: PIN domain-containing protein [Enterobacterales]|uniref:PIN domain-containing protein n=1 Tax=Enterobacterales TaxID=91347 RepID=UPI00136C945A|nr:MULTISPECIES: PIN domain-containing protein [Enterobacterales]MBE1255154.1 PIN domain-containing protein [Enterobacter cloacae]UMB75929.1 PIN domain-containing protein [Dickeya fangzhongdai]
MNRTYMLDTRFCAFILREQPEAVLGRLEQAVLRGHRIVISAVTWAELSQAAREDSPATQALADAFCASLDAVLPWDRAAVDATTEIKAALAATGTPLGPNDAAIAGHAIAAGAVLVTRNGEEFERVPGLILQDWAG